MTRLEKASVVFACSAALVATAPAVAKAWNAGTHTYVASQLHKGGPAPEAELVARWWGANGPDLFNYVLAEPYLTAADYLHDYLGENASLRLWQTAAATGDPVLMGYAYGFAAHDNAFGADYTAHVDAVTGGLRDGYVIAKAEAYAALVGDSLPVTPEQLPLVSHLLVELGVDVLVQQELDPDIGWKLLDSAAADERIGALLATAFAEPLGGVFGGPENAAGAILAMDAVYRTQIMPWYASALVQEDAFAGVASWISQAATQLMGLDIPEPVAQQALAAAMDLCRSDYQRELFATIGRVNAALSKRHIVP